MFVMFMMKNTMDGCQVVDVSGHGDGDGNGNGNAYDDAYC